MAHFLSSVTHAILNHRREGNTRSTASGIQQCGTFSDFIRCAARVEDFTVSDPPHTSIWTGDQSGALTVRAPHDGASVFSFERNSKAFVFAMLYYAPHLWLGLSDGHVIVLNVQMLQIVLECKPHTSAVTSFTAAQNFVYSSSCDFGILQWNAASLRILAFGRMCAHHYPVQCLVSSRNWIYSADSDGLIHVWDVHWPKSPQSPIFSLCGHRAEVTVLTLVDDTLYSGDRSGVLLMWDIQMRRPAKRFRGENSVCLSLYYDQLSRHLWCGYGNGKIHIYDVDTHRPLGYLSEHTGSAVCLIQHVSYERILYVVQICDAGRVVISYLAKLNAKGINSGRQGVHIGEQYILSRKISACNELRKVSWCRINALRKEFTKLRALALLRVSNLKDHRIIRNALLKWRKKSADHFTCGVHLVKQMRIGLLRNIFSHFSCWHSYPYEERTRRLTMHSLPKALTFEFHRCRHNTVTRFEQTILRRLHQQCMCDLQKKFFNQIMLAKRAVYWRTWALFLKSSTEKEILIACSEQVRTTVSSRVLIHAWTKWDHLINQKKTCKGYTPNPSLPYRQYLLRNAFARWKDVLGSCRTSERSRRLALWLCHKNSVIQQRFHWTRLKHHSHVSRIGRLKSYSADSELLNKEASPKPVPTFELESETSDASSEVRRMQFQCVQIENLRDHYKNELQQIHERTITHYSEPHCEQETEEFYILIHTLKAKCMNCMECLEMIGMSHAHASKNAAMLFLRGSSNLERLLIRSVQSEALYSKTDPCAWNASSGALFKIKNSQKLWKRFLLAIVQIILSCDSAVGDNFSAASSEMYKQIQNRKQILVRNYILILGLAAHCFTACSNKKNSAGRTCPRHKLHPFDQLYPRESDSRSSVEYVSKDSHFSRLDSVSPSYSEASLLSATLSSLDIASVNIDLGLKLAEVPHPTGIVVESVQPDGAASDAGLHSDDVLVYFGGSSLRHKKTLQAFFSALGRHAVPGEFVSIVYLRDGSPHSTDLLIPEDARDMFDLDRVEKDKIELEIEHTDA